MVEATEATCFEMQSCFFKIVCSNLVVVVVFMSIGLLFCLIGYFH